MLAFFLFTRDVIRSDQQKYESLALSGGCETEALERVVANCLGSHVTLQRSVFILAWVLLLNLLANLHNRIVTVCNRIILLLRK